MFFHLFYSSSSRRPLLLLLLLTARPTDCPSASRSDLTTCYSVAGGGRHILRQHGIRHKKVGKNVADIDDYKAHIITRIEWASSLKEILQTHYVYMKTWYFNSFIATKIFLSTRCLCLAEDIYRDSGIPRLTSFVSTAKYEHAESSWGDRNTCNRKPFLSSLYS